MKTVIYTPRPSLVARRFRKALHAEQPSMIAEHATAQLHFHPDYGVLCQYSQFSDVATLLASVNLPSESEFFTSLESSESLESSSDSPESLPETSPLV